MSNPAPQGAPLQFAFNAGQGPDGKTWAVITIISGPVTTQVAISPDVFAQLVDQIPAQLTELNAHIRRANLGLIIKTDLNGVKP